MNLLLFNESYNLIFTGFSPVYLDLLTGLSLLSAIFVIITKNPVVSVLYLILLFILIGFYLILVGMTFLGLSYLLVYIGAIAILFLFIIMLLDIKASELININKNSNILGFLITLMFFYPIYSLITTNLTTTGILGGISQGTAINSPSNIFALIFNTLNNITSGYFSNKLDQNKFIDNDLIVAVYNRNWESSLFEENQIAVIGNIMYNNYIIWLFITAFILLLALIGAIILIGKDYSNPVVTTESKELN